MSEKRCCVPKCNVTRLSKQVSSGITNTNTVDEVVTDTEPSVQVFAEPEPSMSLTSVASRVQRHTCRICLENAEFPINLFSEDECSKDIIEKIHACSQVIINFDEHLPSVICSNCIKELDIAYSFRLKCLSFNERFSILCKKTYAHNEDIIALDKDPKSVECSLDLIEDTTNEKCEDTLDVKNEDKNDNASIAISEVEINSDSNQCNICNKILKSKASLLSHNVSMHQKRKHVGKITGFGPSRRYHCTKCLYSTPHSQTLVNHMRRHDGERPFNCECGKSFTQYSSLSAHHKIHTNVANYTCATCGKQFKFAYTLKKHLNVHEETGKYACNVCNKNLKSTQALRDHMHRHYNIKNYNCEDCGDTFVTCSELLNHKKKHSKIKKIQCHLCDYKTHTKKNFAIHLKRHTGDKAYKCGLCELAFYTSGGLQRHHRVHTREKPFSCPTCAQRFTHSTSLNKHMHTVHGLNYKWGDYKFKELNRNNKSTKPINVILENK